MPLSYYLKKYFNKDRNEKFVYPDGYGDIILRNEAWLLLKDVMPLIQTENKDIFAQKILNMQKRDKYSCIRSDNRIEWERFWESVYDCLKNNRN